MIWRSNPVDPKVSGNTTEIQNFGKKKTPEHEPKKLMQELNMKAGILKVSNLECTHITCTGKKSVSHSVSRRDYSRWKEATFMKVMLLNDPVLIWGPRGEVTVPKADMIFVSEPEIAVRFLVPTL